ncbi:DUF1735 domain-containing protein [Flavobacterium soli]|uniref:DUF1735 domain-containing protein n=1 Tax=Flavobacterium soli TaxID=344881 RepID=UPI00041BF4F1|nr:DUF1735 domain-containing protein [Flavobacterium soli]
MKKISLLLMFLSATLFLSCEESDSLTVVPHVSFENDRIFGLNPGETTSTQEVKVYATKSSGSDRVFNLVVNEEFTTLLPSEYTLPATVTIPANSREGSFSVSVTSSDLGEGKTLAIDFADITDGTFTGDEPLKLLAKVVCDLNEVAFELILDRYGSESIWELSGPGGELIASGGPYTDTSTNAAQPAKNFSFCLPAGEYTFVMYDLYGDGMSGPSGNGSFKLTEVATGNILAQGGTFTTESVHTFTLD